MFNKMSHIPFPLRIQYAPKDTNLVPDVLSSHWAEVGLPTVSQPEWSTGSQCPDASPGGVAPRLDEAPPGAWIDAREV